MATIAQLIQLFGDPQSHIKLRKFNMGPGEYFMPFFITKTHLWHGLNSEGVAEVWESSDNVWELYAPVISVKRAQYVVWGPDLKYPYVMDKFFKDDREAYDYANNHCPVPVSVERIPETEREFDR